MKWDKGTPQVIKILEWADTEYECPDCGGKMQKNMNIVARSAGKSGIDTNNAQNVEDMMELLGDAFTRTEAALELDDAIYEGIAQ